MNDRDRNKLHSLIAVYERRISNIQWYIDTHKPTGESLMSCAFRLKDHKDFLSDLKILL